MPDTSFTFRIDDDLKSEFAAIAESQDLSAAQLLRALIREEVRRQREEREHDAWFRGEVEQAMREADDPTVRRLTHEEVRSNWRRQRAELARRIGDKPA